MIQFTLTVCCWIPLHRSGLYKSQFLINFTTHVIWMINVSRVCALDGSLFWKMLTWLSRHQANGCVCVFCRPGVLFAVLFALFSITGLLYGKIHNLCNTHTHTHGRSNVGCPWFLMGSDWSAADTQTAPVSQTWKSEGRSMEECQRENTGLSCRQPSVSNLQKVFVSLQ